MSQIFRHAETESANEQRSLGTVIFLGNGRCYHTLDWFRSARHFSLDNPPILVTDLIESESFVKLIAPGDCVEKLFILDRWLLTEQSRIGNLWRNVLKLLLLPIQVWRFRGILKRLGFPVVHAHSMYYIAIARLSSCRYVATPQGSEILVRPYRSGAYKLFARLALSRAACITVDSVAMRERLVDLYGLDARIVQNGIDIDAIRKLNGSRGYRDRILSIRGFTPLYQIDLLLAARNAQSPGVPLQFCYPFEEHDYRVAVSRMLIETDQDLGRLPREALYRHMLSTKLVISIPNSDSSPRSVYEAIFCGCLIAATNAKWLAGLPPSMGSRIIVVDPTSKTWLLEAVEFADSRIGIPFEPCQEALNLFDQKRTMLELMNTIYPAPACR